MNINMDIQQTTTEQAQALEQLVKELGIDSLPEEKRNELLIKMTEVLLKRIFVETMEKLGEEGREEYEKFLQNDNISPEQAQEFFKTRIPNYESMIQQVIDEFKAEMTSAKA